MRDFVRWAAVVVVVWVRAGVERAEVRLRRARLEAIVGKNLEVQTRREGQ